MPELERIDDGWIGVSVSEWRAAMGQIATSRALSGTKIRRIVSLPSFGQI